MRPCVAIITGSSSGIGEALARYMAARSVLVVINSSKSTEQGERIAAELGENAIYCQADVSQPAEAEHLVMETTKRFGRLDYLINNAATTVEIPHSDFESVTPEVWERILHTNLLGPWYLVKAAASALRADGGGAIVNTSSIAGSQPRGSSIPYAVSKAALNHLTQLLAKVLGPEIRVNAVAPGFVDTPWTNHWDSVRERAIATSPLARVATPQDVAEVCWMLLKARHVTGEVVHVDGGQRFG